MERLGFLVVLVPVSRANVPLRQLRNRDSQFSSCVFYYHSDGNERNRINEILFCANI
jgi:hypothetical protein